MAGGPVLPGPQIENRSLTDTLAGIGAFWRRYDRRFFAHEVPGDIDYQLCLPAPERLLGVDYLISWLSRLLAESRFLNCFDRRAVVRVLEGSCPDYRGLHINLFEPVAVNALGRTLLGLDPLDLALPSEGRARLAGTGCGPCPQRRGKGSSALPAHTQRRTGSGPGDGMVRGGRRRPAVAPGPRRPAAQRFGGDLFVPVGPENAAEAKASAAFV